MAVAKVILVTLVLTLLTLGTVDAHRAGPIDGYEANVLLERRGVSFIKFKNIYQHIG